MVRGVGTGGTRNRHERQTRERAQSNEMNLMSVLKAENLTKKVTSPEGMLTIVNDVSLDIAAAESVAIVGRIRRGQIDAAGAACRPRYADFRTHHPGGRRLDGAGRRRPGAPARRARGIRVPVVSPGAVADRARKRDVAARARGPARCARRRDGNADARGSRTPHRPLSAPALRRRAAARGDCARLRDAAGGAVCGRAHRAISTRTPASASSRCSSISTRSRTPRWCW